MGVMGALALWHVLVHLTAILDIRHLIKTSINDDVTPFNLVGDEAYIPQRRGKKKLKTLPFTIAYRQCKVTVKVQQGR
jgi:hypothetical protein